MKQAKTNEECFYLFTDCILFCYILFSSLQSLFFSNERHKGLDIDGKGGREELGEVDRGRIIIWIYYRRIYLLSTKGKINIKIKQ